MNTLYQNLIICQIRQSKKKLNFIWLDLGLNIFLVKIFVRYYYSHNKFLDAVIVLSDFSVDGWKMSKAKVNLSLDHILTSGENLFINHFLSND